MPPSLCIGPLASHAKPPTASGVARLLSALLRCHERHREILDARLESVLGRDKAMEFLEQLKALKPSAFETVRSYHPGCRDELVLPTPLQANGAPCQQLAPSARLNSLSVTQ